MAQPAQPVPQVADESGDLIKQRFEEFLQRFRKGQPQDAETAESAEVSTYDAQVIHALTSALIPSRWQT
jgi:hypothetical protein